jgi:hypothetical protein
MTASMAVQVLAQPDPFVVIAGVVLNVALALVLPWIALRRMTPGSLREHFVLSKRGRVVAATVVLLALLALVGAVVALAAIHHPFLWATEALILSSIGVVVIYLVRFRAAARAYVGGGVEEHDDADGHTDD